MADVQFVVTESKKITRHGRLIPAGETITIPEGFVKLYYDWGHVVQPAPAPAPAPVQVAMAPVQAPAPEPVKAPKKAEGTVAAQFGPSLNVASKDDVVKPTEEKK